jgi:predicted ATPase
MYRGAALVEAGLSRRDASQVSEGIADGLEGMTAFRATGAALEVPTCLCWFATGHIRLEEVDAASRLLNEARRVIANTGGAYFAAELYRVSGELALVGEAPDPAAAEACPRRGLVLAHRQGAKLLELRVAATLARLLRDQEQFECASNILGAVCESFANDDACRDLTEARAMLSTTESSGRPTYSPQVTASWRDRCPNPGYFEACDRD